MTKSKIEWTDEVWNPITGCTKVSQGCKHCYAETIASRFWKDQYPPNADGSPRKFTDVRLHPERLEDPLKWKKPRRVFVNSMSDLFHNLVPVSFVAKVFAIMAIARQHTFIVLTKRPDRMKFMLDGIFVQALEIWQEYFCSINGWCPQDFEWPLPNVWLGVSVEDQATADERIPLLLQTPAAVRFVSYEPALGPVDFVETVFRPGVWELTGAKTFTAIRIRGIDWIIMGGESGPGARPMHPDWARSVRDQCVAAGVPFFFKQWGGPTKQKIVLDGKLVIHRLLDGREWSEFPEAE